MEKWCEQAPQDKILKYEKHIVEVIKNCNNLVDELKKHGVNFDIVEGFKE